jgi:hypothetical protein
MSRKTTIPIAKLIATTATKIIRVRIRNRVAGMKDAPK